MLARFFIDRPVLAWVISIVIVLLGAIAAGFLPIAEYPEITPPTVQVTANYPGANAQVVADTVAAPIEQQVIGVEEMLYMSSQSNNDGSYTLDVTFELGTNVNMAQVLVQNRVAIALPTLPDVVKTIGVTVKKRSPDILLVVSLYSDDDPETGRPYYDQLYLSNYATIQLKDAAGPGGGRRRRADPRPAGLQHARLAGPGQAAVAQPDGRRRDPGPARAERAGGGRADRPAAGPHGPGLPVHAEHPRPAGRGRAVRRHRPQDRHGRRSHLPPGRQPDRAGGPEARTRCRGSTAGRRRAWASSSCPAPTPWTPPTASRPRCASWRPASPRGCSTPSSTTPRRSSASRSTRCSTPCATPSSWSPSSSCCSCRTGRRCSCRVIDVAVSLVGTFAVMKLMGFTLNNLTLFGLVLAIGIVVDDAIVVLENIERWLDKGLPVREATIKAMDEITGPILAITLVLSSVLLPSAFLGGITGQFFRQFALTISVSMIISADQRHDHDAGPGGLDLRRPQARPARRPGQGSAAVVELRPARRAGDRVAAGADARRLAGPARGRGGRRGGARRPAEPRC